jgi:hypothetical protein
LLAGDSGHQPEEVTVGFYPGQVTLAFLLFLAAGRGYFFRDIMPPSIAI